MCVCVYVCPVRSWALSTVHRDSKTTQQSMDPRRHQLTMQPLSLERAKHRKQFSGSPRALPFAAPLSWLAALSRAWRAAAAAAWRGEDTRAEEGQGTGDAAVFFIFFYFFLYTRGENNTRAEEGRGGTDDVRYTRVRQRFCIGVEIYTHTSCCAYQVAQFTLPLPRHFGRAPRQGPLRWQQLCALSSRGNQSSPFKVCLRRERTTRNTGGV